MEKNDRLQRLEDVEARCGITRSTIYRLTRERLLPRVVQGINERGIAHHQGSICPLHARDLENAPEPVHRPRYTSPVVRTILVSAMSDRGHPGATGDGMTISESSLSGRTSTSTASAASLRGTRCSAPTFMCPPRMRHSQARGTADVAVTTRHGTGQQP